MKRFTKAGVAMTAGAWLLAGCGGGGGSSDGSSTPAALRSGQLGNIPIAGVSYTSSSDQRGVTDGNGQFSYRDGDTVTFKIGNITLGTVSGAALVNATRLTAAAANGDDVVLKLVQLINTLDQDGDPSNGVVITSASNNALSDNIAFSAATADIALTNVSNKLAAKSLETSNTTLVSKTAAEIYYFDSLARTETLDLIAGAKMQSVLIGGGLNSCLSTSSAARCQLNWSEILKKDPAFAGIDLASVNLDPNFNPTQLPFSYTLTAAKSSSLTSSNAFSADKLPSLQKALAALGASGALTNPVSWAQAKGAIDSAAGTVAYVEFANGTDFYNQSTDADFNTYLGSLVVLPQQGSFTNAANRFDITAANIAKLRAARFEQPSDQVKIALVLDGLLKAPAKLTGLNYEDLKTLVKAASVNAAGQTKGSITGFSETLSPPELATLRETLVVPTPYAGRKLELNSPRYASNAYTRDLYQQFVATAQASAGRKPNIVVVTAASENPFYDADFYTYGLRSAGANANWLPISGGFRKALDSASCAKLNILYSAYANTASSVANTFHQDLVFPDLAKIQSDACSNPQSLYDQLANADAIFFGGGDQARHLEALLTKGIDGQYSVASRELQILRDRFAAGRLLVGGTSAGTAVQGGGKLGSADIPMLGGGDSYSALKSGFIAGSGPTPDDTGSIGLSYAKGGLALFGQGIIDSHFSLRTREGRLIRLAKESGVRYGFGVDENTALLTSQPLAGKVTLTVLGAGGVYIADVKSAVSTTAKNAPFNISGVRSHYLTTGDKAVFDVATGEMTISLAASKRPPLPVSAAAIPSTRTVFEYGSSSYLNFATAFVNSGVAEATGDTSGSSNQASPVFRVRLSRTADTAVARGGSTVSYKNVLVDITTP